MRSSRRWLLASMGASAVAAVAHADDQKPAARRATAVGCEGSHATDVKIDKWINKPPADVDSATDALLEVYKYGFEYGYVGTPRITRGFENRLAGAYGDLVGAALGAKWPMAVAQAFILGQLTQYSWRVSQEPPKVPLNFRHLAFAWAAFGIATSSSSCEEWIVTKKAYVLPALPTRDNQQVRQIDEPCALCNTEGG